MKLFQEETEDRRERNRNVRWGRWGRLILLIIGAYLTSQMIRGITSDGVNWMLWFIGVGR